ncbi:16S rRNA (guanine(527)-N(7))-methyltransferase RsmG [Mariprofundus ferrinatatus]|uniref:Ribosomal RNA small subunit methyltransferase G n=1 Tax=Mariprofundus ferrinatatus TaxID=1921087 RepID=A0A2K8L734_9PROT|nr:RsmG family class I SAM-dependent methyltransferase [Mariprofundus ferrinatatus]ATX83110.1 16S rRNA (guanine(527)-N(7))-methyltransferase RsmG [Mariprofundus ferrinatatus]
MSCDAYVQEVMKFRRALNLTSISDPALFNAQFIEPSLALAEWLPHEGRMLDIGSGMGVPGIPLIIELPGLVGVLVERRKKRAEFLRHVVRKLHLNAEVYDADVNDLPSLKIDVCVARAVTDEAGLLNMCTPHVNANATAVFPVPVSRQPAAVEGWRLEGEHNLNIAGGDGIQRIRCYRYCDGLQGGFT